MLLFPEIRLAAIAATGKDPYLRYKQHVASAKVRGIEFDLTFPEWWEIWQDRFDQRGPHTGEYVMCRTRDEGAYRPGNVRIDTGANNVKEYQVSSTRRQFAQAWDENPEASDWMRPLKANRPEWVLAEKRGEFDD